MRRIDIIGTTELFLMLGGSLRPVREWLDGHAPLSPDEHAEMTTAYAGTLLIPRGGFQERPLRAPHYTTSPAGLFGHKAAPGEVCLSTCGALVLLEVPRFGIHTLQKLHRAIRAGVSQGRPAAPLAVVLGE